MVSGVFLKKVSNSEKTKNNNEMCAVALEPLLGYSDKDVVALLNRVGASEVMVIAPGYISAMVRRSVIKNAESIAYVHIKPPKSLR